MRIILLFSFIFIASCVNNLDAVGYKIEQSEIDTIKKNKYSKEQIAAMLGSPTLTSDVGSDSWFYVFYIRNKVAFYYPEVEDIQIVEFDFDKNGVIASIEEFSKDTLHKIKMDSEQTPTKGTSMNPLYHILQNIQKHSIPVPIQKKKPQS